MYLSAFWKVFLISSTVLLSSWVNRTDKLITMRKAWGPGEEYVKQFIISMITSWLLSWVSKIPGVSMMEICLPPLRILWELHSLVCEVGLAADWNTFLPRMVFPEALFPTPVFPRSTSLTWGTCSPSCFWRSAAPETTQKISVKGFLSFKSCIHK